MEKFLGNTPKNRIFLLFTGQLQKLLSPCLLFSIVVYKWTLEVRSAHLRSNSNWENGLRLVLNTAAILPPSLHLVRLVRSGKDAHYPLVGRIPHFVSSVRGRRVPGLAPGGFVPQYLQMNYTESKEDCNQRGQASLICLPGKGRTL